MIADSKKNVCREKIQFEKNKTKKKIAVFYIKIIFSQWKKNKLNSKTTKLSKSSSQSLIKNKKILKLKQNKNRNKTKYKYCTYKWEKIKEIS